MSLFIESLAFFNGTLLHLNLHNKRLNETRKKFYTQCSPIFIENEVTLPKEWQINTLYKCRLVYSKSIESFDFIKYEPKKTESIQLIFDETMNYDYKYENRNCFTTYLQKSPANEVLFIKDNSLTDASYANLIFFDGTEWVTPKTFLLNGIQRQFLLQNKHIVEKEIKVDEIKKYTHFKLINALLSPQNSPLLSTTILYL